MGRFVGVTQPTAIVMYLLVPQLNSNCCRENNRWLLAIVTLGNASPRSITMFHPKIKLEGKISAGQSHGITKVKIEQQSKAIAHLFLTSMWLWQNSRSCLRVIACASLFFFFLFFFFFLTYNWSISLCSQRSWREKK